MFKRRTATGLAAGCIAFGAAGGTEGALAADAPAAPATVQLAAVALPIVVDGRLINYVFVTVKLDLAAGVDGAAVRAKEPYFRDALVRAAHRSPFVLRTDYDHVDAAKLRAVMLRETAAIAGANVIRDVVVTEQTPQHQLPSPRPAPSH